MAWRKQPYYDQLHPWTRNNFDKEIYVLVFVNDEATLILPDQDVAIGKPKRSNFGSQGPRSRPCNL